MKRLFQKLTGTLPPPSSQPSSHPKEREERNENESGKEDDIPSSDPISSSPPILPPIESEPSERHVSSTELLSHRSDLWVVIHGQVYDLSRYAEYHPGGDDILRDVAGKDATDEWLNVNHGPEAKELMKAYVIGHYVE